MKQAFRNILLYFPKQWKSELNWGYYLSVLGMLGIFTAINYFWFPEVTVERWMTRAYFGTWKCTLGYLFFYGVPYYATIGLYRIFHGRAEWMSQRKFWFMSLFGLFVLSFDASFHWHQLLIKGFTSYPARYVWAKWLGNFHSTLTMGAILWGFWYFYDRRYTDTFYGLTRKGFDWRPYSILLLLMVPLVAAAAFTSDFLNYYPTLKMSVVERYDLLPSGWILAIYEFIYASDFIWTELIFRGFFVIGLSRIMGTTAVVPMCTIYEFRHFAKPLGESISSIFGGYILGVIALHSRNIFGGVWVHMGIALLMELLAILIKGAIA